MHSCQRLLFNRHTNNMLSDESPRTRSTGIHDHSGRSGLRRTTPLCFRSLRRFRGAGPLARGRPPGRPAQTQEEPDQGVRRGRGRPPQVWLRLGWPISSALFGAHGSAARGRLENRPAGPHDPQEVRAWFDLSNTVQRESSFC